MPQNLEDTETQIDLDAASEEISSDLFGQGDDEGTEARSSEETGKVTPEDAEASVVEPSSSQPEEPVKPEEQNSEAVQATGAPETWSKDAIADWATIPPRAQQEILKREQDMFRGLEQYKERAELGTQYTKVVEPYAPILAAENINPVELFQNFAANHYMLSRGTPEQKVQVAAQLINSYGIDLSQLLGHIGGYTEPDPQVQSLRTEINELKSQLGTVAQERQQQVLDRVNREVEEFAADPAHPLFVEVKSEMAKLLQAGIATDLQDAYDKAIYANPQTRQKELDRLTALRAQEAAQQAEAAKKKIAAATATDVTLSQRDRDGTVPLGSIDDTLNSTLAAIANRG